MELAEFISLSEGFQKDSKVIEEVEDIKEESLKDKNLKYILEHFPSQEKMFCVESCIEDLVEYAGSIDKRYNSECLTFFLECFYNDFKLYAGKYRYEVCQNIYDFFYMENESIYYYLKYNKEYRGVLSKKDFQTFRFKNGNKIPPMKLLQFFIDFFQIQVYLVSSKELMIPNGMEEYNTKIPILFMDYDHHLWILYRVNKQKFQLDALL